MGRSRQMLDAFIYGGIRTPFGRYAGALSAVRPDDMLAEAIKAAVSQAPFSPDDYEDIIIGCGNQGGEDSRCVARHAGLLAGLPIEVAGTVIQRNCGSGLGAIMSAAHAATVGEGSLFVTGGVESMSRAPLVLSKAAGPYSRNVELYDTTVGARFPNPRLVAKVGGDTNAETADNLACDYQIARDDCDAFALRSQTRYAAAKAGDFLKGEILAMDVPSGRKMPLAEIMEDEFPRPGTTIGALAKLRPLNGEGVTTAGNSSGINDGAAVVLVGSRQAGEAAACEPMARILSTAVAGVPPRIMGIGPVPASRKALERAGLTLNDMDVIEINEAFAAQVLACLKAMDIAYDDSRINPNGGAIAIGHPLGASGARLALTAARQLKRTGGRYALIALCIGVGQGIAMVIERAGAAGTGAACRVGEAKD